MIEFFIKEHLHEIVDVIIDQLEKSLNDFKEHEKIITYLNDNEIINLFNPIKDAALLYTNLL
jgi:hypothetical protein